MQRLLSRACGWSWCCRSYTRAYSRTIQTYVYSRVYSRVYIQLVTVDTAACDAAVTELCVRMELVLQVLRLPRGLPCGCLVAILCLIGEREIYTAVCADHTQLYLQPHIRL
jgi:hypothetical protein